MKCSAVACNSWRINRSQRQNPTLQPSPIFGAHSRKKTTACPDRSSFVPAENIFSVLQVNASWVTAARAPLLSTTKNHVLASAHAMFALQAAHRYRVCESLTRSVKLIADPQMRPVSTTLTAPTTLLLARTSSGTKAIAAVVQALRAMSMTRLCSEWTPTTALCAHCTATLREAGSGV